MPVASRRRAAVSGTPARLAADALADFIAYRPVTCETVDRDRYGWAVATCAVDGADLGGLMIRAGWARDYPRYSSEHYGDDERAARDAGSGAWAADCMAPWEWRRQR